MVPRMLTQACTNTLHSHIHITHNTERTLSVNVCVNVEIGFHGRDPQKIGFLMIESDGCCIAVH